MRLIDVDELRKEHCKGCNLDMQQGCLSDPLCASMMWLHDAPAVDAVEVVRCKDCKRCFEKRTRRHNNLMRFCMRLDGNEFQVNANDFCSYGERKEK